MFQDYCAAHGKPCPPGSLYCSEECRLEDIKECTSSSEKPKDAYLMYECPYCNSTHKCTHKSNFTLNSGSGNITNNIDNRSIPQPPSPSSSPSPSHINYKQPMLYHPSILDTLQDYSQDNDQIIQLNYKKWLINATPKY